MKHRYGKSKAVIVILMAAVLALQTTAFAATGADITATVFEGRGESGLFGFDEGGTVGEYGKVIATSQNHFISIGAVDNGSVEGIIREYALNEARDAYEVARTQTIKPAGSQTSVCITDILEIKNASTQDGIVVAGYYTMAGGALVPFIAKYDSLLNEQLWIESFGDETSGMTVFQSIALDKDGNVVAAGVTKGGTHADYLEAGGGGALGTGYGVEGLLVKYNSVTGNKMSSRMIQNENNIGFYDIEVNADGDYYLCGQTSGVELGGPGAGNWVANISGRTNPDEHNPDTDFHALLMLYNPSGTDGMFPAGSGDNTARIEAGAPPILWWDLIGSFTTAANNYSDCLMDILLLSDGGVMATGYANAEKYDVYNNNIINTSAENRAKMDRYQKAAKETITPYSQVQNGGEVNGCAGLIVRYGKSGDQAWEKCYFGETEITAQAWEPDAAKETFFNQLVVTQPNGVISAVGNTILGTRSGVYDGVVVGFDAGNGAIRQSEYFTGSIEGEASAVAETRDFFMWSAAYIDCNTRSFAGCRTSDSITGVAALPTATYTGSVQAFTVFLSGDEAPQVTVDEKIVHSVYDGKLSAAQMEAYMDITDDVDARADLTVAFQEQMQPNSAFVPDRVSGIANPTGQWGIDWSHAATYYVPFTVTDTAGNTTRGYLIIELIGNPNTGR